MVKVVLGTDSKITMLRVEDKPLLLPDAIEVDDELYEKYLVARKKYLMIEDELLSLYRKNNKLPGVY